MPPRRSDANTRVTRSAKGRTDHEEETSTSKSRKRSSAKQRQHERSSGPEEKEAVFSTSQNNVKRCKISSAPLLIAVPPKSMIDSAPHHSGSREPTQRSSSQDAKKSKDKSKRAKKGMDCSTSSRKQEHRTKFEPVARRPTRKRTYASLYQEEASKVQRLSSQLKQFKRLHAAKNREARIKQQQLRELVKHRDSHIKCCNENVEDVQSRFVSMASERDRLQRQLEELKRPNSQASKSFLKLCETALNCPICADLFIEPVVGGCGHVFCKYCITRWMKSKTECPVCRQVIQQPVAIPVIQEILEQFEEAMDIEAKVARRKAVEERKSAPMSDVSEADSSEWEDLTNWVDDETAEAMRRLRQRFFDVDNAFDLNHIAAIFRRRPFGTGPRDDNDAADHEEDDHESISTDSTPRSPIIPFEFSGVYDGDNNNYDDIEMMQDEDGRPSSDDNDSNSGVNNLTDDDLFVDGIDDADLDEPGIEFAAVRGSPRPRLRSPPPSFLVAPFTPSPASSPGASNSGSQHGSMSSSDHSALFHRLRQRMIQAGNQFRRYGDEGQGSSSDTAMETNSNSDRPAANNDGPGLFSFNHRSNDYCSTNNSFDDNNNFERRTPVPSPSYHSSFSNDGAGSISPITSHFDGNRLYRLRSPEMMEPDDSVFPRDDNDSESVGDQSMLDTSVYSPAFSPPYESRFSSTSTDAEGNNMSPGFQPDAVAVQSTTSPGFQSDFDGYSPTSPQYYSPMANRQNSDSGSSSPVIPTAPRRSFMLSPYGSATSPENSSCYSHTSPTSWSPEHSPPYSPTSPRSASPHSPLYSPTSPRSASPHSPLYSPTSPRSASPHSLLYSSTSPTSWSPEHSLDYSPTSPTYQNSPTSWRNYNNGLIAYNRAADSYTERFPWLNRSPSYSPLHSTGPSSPRTSAEYSSISSQYSPPIEDSPRSPQQNSPMRYSTSSYSGYSPTSPMHSPQSSTIDITNDTVRSSFSRSRHSSGCSESTTLSGNMSPVLNGWRNSNNGSRSFSYHSPSATDRDRSVSDNELSSPNASPIYDYESCSTVRSSSPLSYVQRLSPAEESDSNEYSGSSPTRTSHLEMPSASKGGSRTHLSTRHHSSSRHAVANGEEHEDNHENSYNSNFAGSYYGNVSSVSRECGSGAFGQAPGVYDQQNAGPSKRNRVNDITYNSTNAYTTDRFSSLSESEYGQRNNRQQAKRSHRHEPRRRK